MRQLCTTPFSDVPQPDDQGLELTVSCMQGSMKRFSVGVVSTSVAFTSGAAVFMPRRSVLQSLCRVTFDVVKTSHSNGSALKTSCFAPRPSSAVHAQHCEAQGMFARENNEVNIQLRKSTAITRRWQRMCHSTCLAAHVSFSLSSQSCNHTLAGSCLLVSDIKISRTSIDGLCQHRRRGNFMPIVLLISSNLEHRNSLHISTRD